MFLIPIGKGLDKTLNTGFKNNRHIAFFYADDSTSESDGFISDDDKDPSDKNDCNLIRYNTYVYSVFKRNSYRSWKLLKGKYQDLNKLNSRQTVVSEYRDSGNKNSKNLTVSNTTWANINDIYTHRQNRSVNRSKEVLSSSSVKRCSFPKKFTLSDSNRITNYISVVNKLNINQNLKNKNKGQEELKEVSNNSDCDSDNLRSSILEREVGRHDSIDLQSVTSVDNRESLLVNVNKTISSSEKNKSNEMSAASSLSMSIARKRKRESNCLENNEEIGVTVKKRKKEVKSDIGAASKQILIDDLLKNAKNRTNYDTDSSADVFVNKQKKFSSEKIVSTSNFVADSVTKKKILNRKSVDSLQHSSGISEDEGISSEHRNDLSSNFSGIGTQEINFDDAISKQSLSVNKSSKDSVSSSSSDTNDDKIDKTVIGLLKGKSRNISDKNSSSTENLSKYSKVDHSKEMVDRSKFCRSSNESSDENSNNSKNDLSNFNIAREQFKSKYSLKNSFVIDKGDKSSPRKSYSSSPKNFIEEKSKYSRRNSNCRQRSISVSSSNSSDNNKDQEETRTKRKRFSESSLINFEGDNSSGEARSKSKSSVVRRNSSQSSNPDVDKTDLESVKKYRNTSDSSSDECSTSIKQDQCPSLSDSSVDEKAQRVSKGKRKPFDLPPKNADKNIAKSSKERRRSSTSSSDNSTDRKDKVTSRKSCASRKNSIGDLRQGSSSTSNGSEEEGLKEICSNPNNKSSESLKTMGVNSNNDRSKTSPYRQHHSSLSSLSCLENEGKEASKIKKNLPESSLENVESDLSKANLKRSADKCRRSSVSSLSDSDVAKDRGKQLPSSQPVATYVNSTLVSKSSKNNISDVTLLQTPCFMNSLNSKPTSTPFKKRNINCKDDLSPSSSDDESNRPPPVDGSVSCDSEEESSVNRKVDHYKSQVVPDAIKKIELKLYEGICSEQFEEDLLFVEDISDNDEIWMAQCPKSLKVESLLGSRFNLNGKTTISASTEDGESNVSYEAFSSALSDGNKDVSSNATVNSVYCLIPSRKQRKLKLKAIETKGTIKIEERILLPTPNSIKFTSSTEVHFPENLKIRHPLLGSDFSEHLKALEYFNKSSGSSTTFGSRDCFRNISNRSKGSSGGSHKKKKRKRSHSTSVNEEADTVGEEHAEYYCMSKFLPTPEDHTVSKRHKKKKKSKGGEDLYVVDDVTKSFDQSEEQNRLSCASIYSGGAFEGDNDGLQSSSKKKKKKRRKRDTEELDADIPNLSEEQNRLSCASIYSGGAFEEDNDGLQSPSKKKKKKRRMRDTEELDADIPNLNALYVVEEDDGLHTTKVDKEQLMELDEESMTHKRKKKRKH